MSPGKRKTALLDRLIALAGTARVAPALATHHDELLVDHVIALRNRAADLVRRDPAAALALSNLALAIAESLGTDDALAWGWRTLGETHFLSGRLAEALPAYEQAVSRYRMSGGGLEMSRTMVAWMNLLAMTGDTGRALEVAEETLPVLKRHKDVEYLAKYFMNRGNLYLGTQECDDALRCYQKADRYFDRLQAPKVARIGLYVNRATAYVYLDRFESALTAYEEARAAAQEAGATHLAAQITHNLGHAHLVASRLQEALVLLKEARDVFAAADDDLEVAKCDLNRSDAYLRLQMPAEALALATEAGATFEKNGVASDHAIALSNQGKAFLGIGDHERGVSALREAFSIFAREANVLRAGICAFQLVFQYLAGNDTRRAESWLARGKEISGGHKVRSALVMQDLAEASVLVAGNERAAAQAVLRRARARARRFVNPLLKIQIERLSGDLHRSEGRPGAAMQAWERAAHAVEEMRSELGSDLFRISFLRNQSGIYDAMLETAMAAKRPDTARMFVLSERARSRALLDQMNAGGNGASESRGEGVDALETRLSWLRTQFDTLSVDESDEKRLARLQAAIRDCEREIASAGVQNEEGIRKAAAAAPALSYEDCRRAVGTRETAVYYTVLEHAVVAFVYNRNRSKRVVLTTDPSELLRLITKLRNHIEQFSMPPDFLERRMNRLIRDANGILAELGRALWTPVARHVAGKAVVVFPHRLLHGVPFHAMIEGGEFLSDRHSFRYGVAASVDRHLKRGKGLRNGVAFLRSYAQDGLETLDDEIRSVRKELSGFRLARAGRGVPGLLRALSESDVVHLATHGEFRSDNPQFSALSLGDQNLYLYQLRHARMRPSLVTLSACQTGDSFVEKGDELVGMVRGFLGAGARAMLVSLWKVDDRATTAMMKRFYRSLTGGARKSEALREASLLVRETHPHPYYWAPFVVIGNDGPLRVGPVH